MQTESTKQDKGQVAGKGQAARGTLTTCECTPDNPAVAFAAETIEGARRDRNVLIAGNSTQSPSKWTEGQ